MGIALFIVGLVLGIACLGYFIYRITKFCKSHIIGETTAKIDSTERTYLLGLALAQGVFTIISSIGLILMKSWPLTVGEYFLLIIGSYLFGSGFAAIIGGFSLYYYRPDLDEKQRKICRIVTFAAIPVILGGLIMLTEGFADYIDWRKGLPNGFGLGGIDYVAPYDNGEFSIKFYGIIMIFGALISYFVCDHYFFKKYKTHGILDTLFVFAFICGVIGARLWYCLILESEKYLENPGDIIKIFEGGLAIQGGAIFGILGGLSFLLIFRKYVDVRFAMDVALPSILLAQFIGRWGNFFNREVYGSIVSEQSLYWLPTIIRNNMLIHGEYRLPLFFIEGVLNLGGYFFIRYFLGKVCKFKLGLGYQASFYLIWYGMVRAALEPLREGFTLKVGASSAYGYMQSWIISFCMIGAGVLLLVGFIVIHKVRMNKGLENKDGEKI